MSRTRIHSYDPVRRIGGTCPSRVKSLVGDQNCGAYYLSERQHGENAAVVLEPGEQLLDRFTMESLLGRGGYGNVYLASDILRCTKVALKVVPVVSEPVAAHLKQEIDLYSRVVDNRHVIRVFDLHCAPYAGMFLLLVSMEYADGGSFRQWLLEHKDDTDQRRSEGLHLFRQLCHGVQALHDVGIAHLDLKPENALLVHGVLKISDLGLSRCANNISMRSHSSRLDGLACLPGTPAYMSPEQFVAPHPEDIDGVSDIYSLGVILFEICHSKCRTPFGGSYLQLRERHLHVPAPDLDHVEANVARVVSRCLQKRPADRYSSLVELIDDLENKHRASEGDDLDDDMNQHESDQLEQLWERACHLAEAGSLDEASGCCTQILGVQPEHDEAKCMIQEIRNRYVKAEQFYKAIERGMGCKSLHELSTLLCEAVAVYPNHPDGHLIQTQLLSLAGQYKDFMREGITAISGGHWREALANFERARQFNPGLPAIIGLIDFVGEVIRNTDAAQASIDAAVEQRNRRKAMALARGLDEYVEQIRYAVS